LSEAHQRLEHSEAGYAEQRAVCELQTLQITSPESSLSASRQAADDLAVRLAESEDGNRRLQERIRATTAELEERRVLLDRLVRTRIYLASTACYDGLDSGGG